MAKPELGNRHQCRSCGARFFDLNKSLITCPKCGTISRAAPLSRAVQSASAADEELVSLEEADTGEEKVPATADDDVEIESADDTILEEEEEGSDDVGDLIDCEIAEEER